MFIGAEVRLGLGFSTAQARLASLACGGMLRHASDNAYRGLVAQPTIRTFTRHIGAAITDPGRRRGG